LLFVQEFKQDVQDMQDDFKVLILFILYILFISGLSGLGDTTMSEITLRPADIDRDFGQLAALFTSEQLEPTTEPGLRDDYEQHKERIFRLMVAENEQGELLGFNWATRSRFDANDAYFYVIVKPECREQGAGRLLYADVEQAARQAQVMKLQLSVRDDTPKCRAFVERRDFVEKTHSMAMALDLTTFDDRPYDAIIAKLKGEGYQFTSMEALGNSEDAQRKLYALNDTAARETMGYDGSPTWLSFEDFQKSVCQADWYIPAAQNVVIDTATGIWAAMSATTRFAGADYAYNLFTGVDKRYRGRKLAQAVKVIALRYARDVLKVNTVRTHHNTKNDPMIAIDRKLGYVQTPGMYAMEKNLPFASDESDALQGKPA
jgi:GNAT superfamily N-acetyltransferase